MVTGKAISISFSSLESKEPVNIEFNLLQQKYQTDWYHACEGLGVQDDPKALRYAAFVLGELYLLHPVGIICKKP